MWKKGKSCNLCDRSTSGTPNFPGECDSGAAVSLYVCRYFCTIRNPFYLFIYLLLLTSAPSKKKNVSLSFVEAFVVPGGAGQFRVSLCECSSCLCSLSWLGLSPLSVLYGPVQVFYILPHHEAHGQEGFKGSQHQQAEIPSRLFLHSPTLLTLGNSKHWLITNNCCLGGHLLCYSSFPCNPVMGMCFFSFFWGSSVHFLICRVICPAWSFV